MWPRLQAEASNGPDAGEGWTGGPHRIISGRTVSEVWSAGFIVAGSKVTSALCAAAAGFPPS